MKFRRLFAAILSALMICSCFSFTASAQDTQTVSDPVKYFTAKSKSGVFIAKEGLTKTHTYDAVNDVIFYRQTSNGTGGSMHYDSYGLGQIPVTDGVIYFAMDYRSNLSTTPRVQVYGAKLYDGSSNNGGRFSAESATKGDGTWERIVIKFENSNLKEFNQNHILFLGDYTNSAFTGDKYFDVAAFGFFNDEYSAKNYDFGTAIEADGAVTFSIDGEETDVVPESDPEVEGKIFIGWSSDDAATRGEELTALSTVPTAEGATYYALFTGTVEDEKAVYISANGDDTNNSGRHSRTPVATFEKALALMGDGIDTIYVVGQYTLPGSINLGKAGIKTVNVYGYNGTSDAIHVVNNHINFVGDVVIDNISLSRTDNDGGYQLQGHNVTIGTNVKTSGGSNFISQGYYGSDITDADGSVLTIKSGTWNRVMTGTFTNNTYTGNPTHNIGGTAVIKRIGGGHGSGSIQTVKGTYTLNVTDSAVIDLVDFTCSGGNNPTNKHYGARFINVNGGTVTAIKTTSSVDRDVNAGVTVITVNDGTVGSIAQNLADTTNKRVVIFNDGVEAITVADDNAIVIDVTGGALEADVTVEEDYTATLNGYTFEAADEEYDRVTITPATGEEKTYVLSEITAIPAADLVAGTNKVVFFKYVEEAAEVDVVFDANGGAWADGDTTKVVKTLESEVPVAPTEAPVQAGYTFKGWTPELAPVTAEGATYKAVWEKVYTTIYISNSGKNSNDGLTPETPVRSLSTANTLLARDGIDTLVVVGTFTSEKDADTLGVAGKHITVTGQDANALFEIETYLKKDNGDNIDDDLVLAGPVTFKNIKIKDGSGDGVIQARGNKVVFDEGVAYGGDAIEVAGWSGNNDITIKSGSFGRVFPGTMSGTYNGGTTNINISGGTISNLGLGWGWRGSNIHNGAVYVNVDGGTVKLMTLRSGGDKAANTYRGLRYYTINDGIVESIVTTGGSQYYNNATVAARTGATVFEINKAGVVTGNIALGTNVLTNAAEQDDATRIIIFNNNSYKAGQVTDTGAITVEVRNGAIKADVTMASDYKTTLNGYTFTTDKAKVNINGTNYDAATLGGKIDADKLAEGYNLVVFADADLAPVKWVVGETETQDYAEVGGKLTAPAVTVPAPTKDNYYTFDGWKIGEEPVDFETYTVPAEGATLTAVLTAHEMPASATFDFTGVAAPNNQPIFTGEAVTYKGVEAVKVTPGADVTETSINIEGWEKWPLNKSYPANEKFVNTAIYPYVAVRYFYVPGTAEDLTTGFWINSNNTFEGNNGTTITVDGGAAEAGKWTYVVYDLSATNMANKVSRQYWVQGLKGMTLGDMNKAGVEYYIDTLTIYKDAPTVATITFNAEDGTTLYAIDAINGEAVAFYGDAPTKENHTFLGWAIEGTTDVVDSFAFTADTTLVPVFEENEPVFPTTAQYKTYGIYDELAGTYTVELKIAGGVFNQGAFGFSFPTEQMTFVSATANEEAGIKFLTGTPVTETDKAGYYAAAWYATEDIDGKADASAAEITLVTFEFTMTPEQRAAFVAANATLTEYVNAQPDDAEAFAKYHNGTNYLVAPHDTTPSIERQAVVYKGHVDEVEENAVEYRTYGTYDAAKGTYSIDVKVIGGKFNLGAFGLAFDSQYMTYDPEDESALVLAEDIANYLGVTLANTAEGVAFVWDGSKIEGAGYVDATDAEVLIATIKTTMTPEQREAFVLAQMPMSTLAIDNADYFANGNYLVRPYTNGLDTPKVEAVYASHSDDEAEITTAAVTVKVTFAGKTGATAANIGYISVDGADAVAIDAAGNTEATVEYVIADAVIGDEIELEIFKNGYIGATVTYTVQATANVIEITTIPGDIKGTANALCGDGKVSLDDFVRIIRAFDSAASDDYKASVDLDESGAVNVTDIGLIKTNFGKTTDDVTVVINGQAQ